MTNNAYARRFNWLKNHPPERRGRRKHGRHRREGFQAEAKISHKAMRRNFGFGPVDCTDLTTELVNRGLRIRGADWMFENVTKVREEKVKAREERSWFRPFIELFRRKA